MRLIRFFYYYLCISGFGLSITIYLFLGLGFLGKGLGFRCHRLMCQEWYFFFYRFGPSQIKDFYSSDRRSETEGTGETFPPPSAGLRKTKKQKHKLWIKIYYLITWWNADYNEYGMIDWYVIISCYYMHITTDMYQRIVLICNNINM